MKMVFLAPLLVIIWLASLPARAVSVSTLPKGVRSPAIRFGYISGLGDYFSENGTLYSVGDLRAVRVNAEFLANSSGEAQALVNALNAMSGQNLGSKVDLGTLLVDTTPEIKYYALTFGYGITDRWTVGIGAPMIHYTNDIRLASTRGNRDAYNQLLGGQVSSELDAAWQIDLVQEAHETLAAKGYAPISNRDQTFLGDTQLVSMYRLKKPILGGDVLHRVTVNLPTGPDYDADDLLAPNQFGRTYIENTLNYSKPFMFRGVRAGASLSYSQPIPDQIQARVPRDENDTLPDQSQKETVGRWMGLSVSALADITWNISKAWSVLAGYQWLTKLQDNFYGEGNGRYDLLSDDTAAEAQTVLLGVSTDTVQSYLQTKKGIPLMAQLGFSSTIAGLNTERKVQTEINIMLFF